MMKIENDNDSFSNDFSKDQFFEQQRGASQSFDPKTSLNHDLQFQRQRPELL